MLKLENPEKISAMVAPKNNVAVKAKLVIAPVNQDIVLKIQLMGKPNV